MLSSRLPFCAAGKKQQEAILELLQVERAAGSLMMPETLFKDRPSFERALNKAIIAYNVEKPLLQISPSIKKTILSALSEPDPELRDYEKVPLAEDIWTYFEREVKPHVHDAWIDETVTDSKDGEIGKVGYEINFNRYFYQYQPLRPLAEIEADIKQVEKEILAMLQEVTE